MNEKEKMLYALKELVKEVRPLKLNIRNDFSLINAHAYAQKVIHEVETGIRTGDDGLIRSSKTGKILRPTKKLYPYDAARGWQDLNIALMKYSKG